jgi:hypothetical protein
LLSTWLLRTVPPIRPLSPEKVLQLFLPQRFATSHRARATLESPFPESASIHGRIPVIAVRAECAISNDITYCAYVGER